MNDKELVIRMQHGDMQAFDELYERYKDDAYRLACLITGSRTDGEDLAQEAFVTCAQSIKSLRDGSKFRPVATQNAVPRGVEVLPQGQTGNTGIRVFRHGRERGERTVRRTADG